jgi:uncharacterized membrane protein YccF (DUF307 family)
MAGFVLKLALAYIWGAFWVLVGLIFVLSIIGIPVGMACFGIAAWPVSQVINARLKQQVKAEREEEERDKPLDEDVIYPWEVDT